jgi:dipeptidyl aminopeptidase/acylaminoacyl peptidase
MIAFVARRGGPEALTQLYLLPADGGEARPLTKHATSITQFAWSNDGTTIYFLANEAKTPEEQAKDKVKDDVFAFDENYRISHLWKVRVADGVESRLTSGDFTVAGFRLSRDGTRIVHTRSPSPLLDSAPEGDLWIMDVNGGGLTRVTNNKVAEGDAQLSPDNSMVLFTSGSNPALTEPYFNGKLFTVSASGGTPKVLTGDFPYEVRQAWWSKDGRSIYLLANMGAKSELFSIDAAGGKPRQLTTLNQAMFGEYEPSVDRFVLLASTPVHPAEVFVMDASQSQPTQVTHATDYVTRDFRLPKTEAVTWKGTDGVPVEGILTWPLDYQPGTKYPLVVQTHGGPQASDQLSWAGWFDYPVVYASKGYFVLKPNYRGSTGYGDAFLRDMVGHYFVNAHKDVMAGVDYLIARGLVDSTRMAKMGWSAGGHMTNKVITYTGRFKAAASGAGAANWQSMYAQSDVRTYRTPWFGGTPWQKNAPLAAYWDNSPIKYIANVTTPTIFLVGQQDERVPMPQSVEMYRGLKSNGVPTHLYVAPREGHVWNELRHRVFKGNVELDWFEKWVTKRAYTWEKAPGEKDQKGVAMMQ